jgi:7-cyano-7-deazaguanine reductase
MSKHSQRNIQALLTICAYSSKLAAIDLDLRALRCSGARRGEHRRFSHAFDTNASTRFSGLSRVDLKRLRPTLIAVPRTKRANQLTLLGRSEARIPISPSEARLETFPNPAPNRNYRIHFETDDFTSVCPVTGQPDFARIDIDYVPDRICIESKSLKFYLASYRNERAFNEAVTNRILDDFLKACAPREAIITAQFSARGGIALTVRAEYPDRKVGRDNQ